MQNRSENAVAKSHGQISPRALKHLQHFNKKTAEKLANRISVFSAQLRTESDPKKRCQIFRWIAEWEKEQLALLRGWRNSKIREDLKEEMPATIRAMDEVLEVKRESRRDDIIGRKYREAGRLINRLKRAI